MNTIYLSAERPRIPIGCEDEVRQAVAGDLLVENHYLELKRELPPGRAANRELARDLASFAVDGGTMLIGLDEHDDGTVTLAPQPLARLAERIEQVAATVPDPPLAVITPTAQLTERFAALAGLGLDHVVTTTHGRPWTP